MCETIQEESQKYCAEDIFSLFTNRILTETNSGPGLLPVRMTTTSATITAPPIKVL